MEKEKVEKKLVKKDLGERRTDSARRTG